MQSLLLPVTLCVDSDQLDHWHRRVLHEKAERNLFAYRIRDFFI